jgi:hypothetical protein
LSDLPEELAKDAVRRGWFRAKPPSYTRVHRIGLALLVLSGLTMFIVAGWGLAWWLVPPALAGLALFLKPHLVPRGRTEDGSAVRSEVLRFRQFLRTSDIGHQPGEEPRGPQPVRRTVR